METWGKWTFGGKGYPKCPKKVYSKCPNIPVPISLNCLQMGSGTNGQLEKMDIWRKGVYPKCPKGVSQVPYAHYLSMFKNEPWGKWALGANGHLGKECPKCPVPIPPIFSNKHLGPQVPIYPSAHFALVSIWKK